jgi:hypothetical protein
MVQHAKELGQIRMILPLAEKLLKQQDESRQLEEDLSRFELEYWQSLKSRAPEICEQECKNLELKLAENEKDRSVLVNTVESVNSRPFSARSKILKLRDEARAVVLVQRRNSRLATKTGISLPDLWQFFVRKWIAESFFLIRAICCTAVPREGLDILWDWKLEGFLRCLANTRKCYASDCSRRSER